MPTAVNLQLLITQLPLVAKLASAEQNSPEAQAAFAEQMARQNAARAKTQIQKTERTSGLLAKKERDGQKKRDQPPAEKRDARAEPKADDETQTAEKPSGQIINISI